MKKQSLSISVPEPCHEKWSEMTPAEQGRYCLSCQTMVVDFTRMPKVKIAEFVNQQEGRVCGRFTSDQLNVELIPPRPKRSWFKYAAIVLGLIPSVAFGQKVQDTKVVEQHYTQSNFKGKVYLGNQIPKVKNSKLLKGKLVDAESGEPLLFASVAVYDKGGKLLRGTETDLDGNYEVEVPPGGYVISEYIGYQTQKILYSDLLFGENFNIKMNTGVIIGEVVEVVGLMITDVKKDKDDEAIEEPRMLEGKMISRKTKEPIAFGTILVIDEDGKVFNGVESDMGGKFEIEVPANSKVKFNYIGFNEIEIPYHKLKFNDELVVKMKERRVLMGISFVHKKPSWLERQWEHFKKLVKLSFKKAEEHLQLNRKEYSKAINTENSENSNLTKSTENNAVDAHTKLKVYPNPASERIQIELPEKYKTCVLHISNMKNELVLTKSLGKYERSIGIGHLLPGSYVVSIIYGDNLIHSEVIIKQ